MYKRLRYWATKIKLAHEKGAVPGMKQHQSEIEGIPNAVGVGGP